MRFRTCCAVGAFAFAATTVNAQSDYVVQFGSYSNLTNAQSGLSIMDYDYPDFDFQVTEIGGSYKVTSLPYDTYAEAWALKVSPELESASSFIVEIPENQSQVVDYLPPVFDTSGIGTVERSSFVTMHDDIVSAPSEAAFGKQVANMNSEELVSVGIRGNVTQQRIDALERFVANHPSDSRLNRSSLKLAQLQMRTGNTARSNALLNAVELNGSQDEQNEAKFLKAHQKLYENLPSQAFNKFKDLASDSTVPGEVRYKSMKLAAASAHRAKDYSNAIRAYKQIELEGLDDAAKDEASLKRIGLTFELVRNGKGSWDDVRKLCNEYINSNVSTGLKATAALMEAETYFYEEDYQQSITLCDQLVSNYPLQTREVLMAKFWKGHSLYKLKDFESSETIFQEIAQADGSGVEFFKDQNPIEKAAAWVTYYSDVEAEVDLAPVDNEYLQYEYLDY